MIKVINDEIVAATGDLDKGLLVLNGELETIKCYNGNTKMAQCLEGNENYIALGFRWYFEDHEVRFFPRNGDEQQMINSTVSNHASS